MSGHVQAKPWLRYFFEPRSVAVIGASRTPGRPGHQQLANLLRGYPGRVYAVNPQADRILGLTCHPTVGAIDDQVELAIVLLPAEKAVRAVRECVQHHVPAVLIESAGFGEAGSAGMVLQDQLLDAIRGTGTRLWGPNCNGLVNASLPLLASFVDIPDIRAGDVAFVAQTGIFAAAMLNQLMELPAFGVSKVATLGNKCDVTDADLLEYLADDPETRVIALHLETLRDGGRFFDSCRRVARCKPVIALKAAQTAAGERASLSHTGSLASEFRIARDAFAQAGVITVDDFMELIDVARAFSRWRDRTAARRVAVVTTAGGAGVLAVDHLTRAGLDIARLAPSTVEQLTAVMPLPPGDGVVDIWPAMERHGTDRAVREIAARTLGDPGVDGALFIFGVFSGGLEFDPVVPARIAAACGKPAAAWLYGGRRFREHWMLDFEEAGVPVFYDLRTAAKALAGHAAHVGLRSQADAVEATAADSPRAVPPEAKQLIEDALAAGRVVLVEPEAHRFLGLWGIRSARHTLAVTEDQAVAEAERIGGPVALKIVSPDIPHRARIGGVALDVAGPDAVRVAFRRVREAARAAVPEATIDGVLVQEMVPGEREVIVGLSRDPHYGYVLMFGFGGVWVEIIEDLAFRLPPLDSREIDRMIESTRAAKVLEAHGGRARADRAALRQVIRVLSDIAGAGLDVTQVEINPLAVREEGLGAVALDALVVLGGAAS